MYNEETHTPEGAKGCQRKSSQVLVVPETHDLENWSMRDMIMTMIGMQVLLVVLEWRKYSDGAPI